MAERVSLQDRKRITAELKGWMDDISSYDREFDKWCKRVEKIIKRYRDERQTDGDDGARFNILYSNVQTLIPATFSKLPQPDVSRRFRDNDPVGRVASLILERALDFEIQHYPDYKSTMRESVLDRFLGGRGTAWVRYEPHFKAGDGPTDGAQISEDVDDSGEQLDYECAPTDYVHWKDFGHSVARTWEEVPRVWRIVYMTKASLERRFGKEKSKLIAMDASPQEVMSSPDYKPGDPLERAKIYEGWDKEEKCAYWFSKSLKDFIDEREDPLGLEGFFPCPKPLYATLTNDKLIPVPDFVMYQDQAKSLDTLADRIHGLVEALKVMGTYDAATPELARLFTEGANGTLVPVKNWAAFVEKNGLQGAISLVDLKPIAEALKAAYEAFQQIIGFIYQVTGISDIVRGQTDPDETLGAQQLKGQFASLRLRDIQNAVAEYATNLLQLKAQVYCLKFSPETLAKMASVEQLSPEDQQFIQPALALLVGEDRMQNPDAEGKNPLRAFRIEVNADTLVQFDENAEKQNAVEFMKAVGEFLKAGAEIGVAAPPLVPVILECLKWSVSRFKVGKTLEGTIDQALDELKKQIAKAQANPQAQVNPEEIKAQSAQQIETQKQQGEMAREHMRQEGDNARHQMTLASEDQRHAREIQQKLEIAKVDGANDIQKHQMTTEAAKKPVATINAPAEMTKFLEAQSQQHAQQNDVLAQAMTQLSQSMAIMGKALEGFQESAKLMSGPREHKLVRGPDGRAAGSISQPMRQ